MGKFDGILLLSDMDGTLLNGSSTVSPENLSALRYFMAEGGRFSVATGRSKPGMEHFLESLPINAPAVIYNGAVVYDFEAGCPVWQRPLGERGLRLNRFGESVQLATRPDYAPFIERVILSAYITTWPLIFLAALPTV